MSKLEDKAASLLDKLDSVLTQYTPEVYNAAIDVVQVSGISEIVSSFLCIAGTIFIGYFLYKNREFFKEYDISTSNIITDIFMFAGWFGCMFMIIASLVSMFTTILDVWTWISIFNPKLALAHQVLGL